MEDTGSELEINNSPIETDESSKGDHQDQPKKAVEKKEPVQEVVEPKTAELVKTELESKLRDFFPAIKRKYADPGAGWTPAKLEVVSPKKLAPIIRELRDILKEAGAVDPDGLIGTLITEAQEAAAKRQLEQEFINKVLDHGRMVYNSGLEKFYRYMAKGLEKRGKNKKAADK